MTELWLVRHGQTDWNIEGRFQGQSDIPLNEAGLEQAQILSEKLMNEDSFVAIFSSDLKRAYRTAEIIAEPIGLKIQIDPRLREVNQGEWEGKIYKEIVETYNTVWDNRQTNPEDTRPPGGESVKEVAMRVIAAADDITCRYPTGRVMIVSHGLALSTLLCTARNIPLSQAYSHIPHNATPEVVTWPIEGCPEGDSGRK
jgi:broad specificity phosphatase PhoE